MIPYLLAVVGGYLLGDSMKDSQTFADGGMMANGGNVSNIVEKYMHKKNDDVKNLILEMRFNGTDTKKYHKLYKIVVDNIVLENKEIKKEEVEIEVGGYLDNLN